MKKLLLKILPFLIPGFTFAQNINYNNQTFSYNGFNVYHYGLGWYQDPATTSYGPMAYLSAYGGIKFFTAGSPTAVLDVNGNFGIGNIVPTDKLNVRTNTVGNVARFDGGDGLGFIVQSQPGQINLISFGGSSDQTAKYSKLAFQTSPGSANEMIMDLSGNVGIGTNNPSAKLEINGAGVTPLKIVGSSGYMLIDNVSSGQNYYQANNFHQFQGQSGSPILTMLGTGKVGIGTTTPDQMLSVKGTIHSQEVLVDMNGWSDYVFTPSYNLASLSLVKTYIDQNGHLPDMPSEERVIKEGINLGEIVKIQTKKIEELTLYLIALKQENDLLKQSQANIKKTLKRHHII